MKRQEQNKKKIIIGITGTFGSGKTAVANVFRSFGARVIDADKIAHRLLIPGSQAYGKIIRNFGPAILRKDKTIDRRRLSAIVFEDKKKRNKLNNITHPEVIRIIKRRIRDSSSKVIVLDAPLLIEAGLINLVDKLIVVTISPKKQIARLLAKTPLDRGQILKRINAQIAQNQKIRLADFIIDNSASIKQTRKQVQKIRRILWKN
jgi:dephospho-CoA kinase